MGTSFSSTSKMAPSSFLSWLVAFCLCCAFLLFSVCFYITFPRHFKVILSYYGAICLLFNIGADAVMGTDTGKALPPDGSRKGCARDAPHWMDAAVLISLDTALIFSACQSSQRKTYSCFGCAGCAFFIWKRMEARRKVTLFRLRLFARSKTSLFALDTASRSMVPIVAALLVFIKFTPSLML